MSEHTADADTIRSGTQQLHEEVRIALRGVAHFASRAHGGDTSCVNDLRAALRRLAQSLRRHDTEERRVLDPFLAQVDAWGPVRVERIERERDAELRLASVDAASPDVRALVRTACGLIRPLARLLHREEREALPPDVLRDDAIPIAQEDG